MDVIKEAVIVADHQLPVILAVRSVAFWAIEGNCQGLDTVEGAEIAALNGLSNFD